MLKAGDPAPDFDVSDHRGKRVKLSDFRLRGYEGGIIELEHNA